MKEVTSMREVFVVSAARTPIGRAGKGSLVEIRPDDLAALVVREALARAGVPAQAVDDVQLGCGYPEGEQGYNLGRRVALLAGLPVRVPGSTVSRMCASSLQAVRTAAHAIAADEADVYIAAGAESLSRVGRTTRPEHRHPALNGDPLPDVYVAMGITAENVAREYGISRDDMDALALRSHRRAVAAQDSGFFDAQIVPVPRPDGTWVTLDDGPRRDTSAERLAALPSAFGAGGPITAGNSCPLNDGAAAAVLASAFAVEKFGLTPRARVLATAVCGVAPEMMGVGPIEAIRTVLTRAGLTSSQLDVVELNEAFAAQVLAVCRAAGIDVVEQLNPHGGAIALGHPFGMTGVRLVQAVVAALEERDGRYGLATLCVGGGQGMAVLLERTR
jgi:acetyl-CoA C-acetyltransferase